MKQKLQLFSLSKKELFSQKSSNLQKQKISWAALR